MAQPLKLSDAEVRVILAMRAAQGVDGVKAATPVATPVKNTFVEKVLKARVPCAYGSKSCASVRFAPNGVGSRQHTTCPKGRAALKAR